MAMTSFSRQLALDGFGAANPAEEPKLIWVSVALVGLLWWGCWGAAIALVTRNFKAASFMLRAIDARTRRMRVRNIALSAPLLATVFNLLTMAILSQPVLTLDASGVFGTEQLVFSWRTTLHGEYIGFCAVSAFVSMAATFVYTSLLQEFGSKQISGSVTTAVVSWAACGLVGGVSVLSGNNVSAKKILTFAVAFFVIAALSGGLVFSAGDRKERPAGEADRIAGLGALPPEVAYVIVAVGFVGLFGVRSFPVVGGTWVPWVTLGCFAVAAISLTATVSIGAQRTGPQKEPTKLSAPFAVLMAAIFGLALSGSAVFRP